MKEGLQQNNPATESEQEKILSTEQTEKTLGLTEADLENMSATAPAEIENLSTQVISEVDQHIEKIATSVGVDAETAKEIFEQGGFAERIKAVKEKIIALTINTKNQIKDLFSSTPEVIHFSDFAEPATAEEKPETVVEIPATETAEVEVVEPQEVETETAPETPEQIERRELKNYLESEVFPTLGLSKEAEEKALAEAPEDKREILERSFENTRNSLNEFYAMEVIDGTIDANERSRAIFLKRDEVTIPVMLEELSKRGFGEVDLAQFNLGEGRQKTGIFTEPSILLRRFLDDESRTVRKDVEAKISRTLVSEGKYRDIMFDANDPNKSMDDETYQKFKDYASEEADQILEQKGLSKTSIQEAHQKIENAWNGIRIEDIPLVFLRKTPEELTESLQAEKELADKTNFLCVNIDAEKLGNVLAQGGFRDIFNLSEEELSEMQRVQSRGDNFYFNQRKVTEEALGVYNPEVSTVYGTYASENNMDEKQGGANMYGSIFLKLKPEVEAVFCEGDSMSGSNRIADRKIKTLGVDRLDYANFARNRQIAPEHAALTKAMNNLYMKIENDSGSPVSAFGYLEAHIKGVKTEDIETINIPRSYTNPQDWRYGGASVVKMLERLQQDPLWKDKINIIENE